MKKKLLTTFICFTLITHPLYVSAMGISEPSVVSEYVYGGTNINIIEEITTDIETTVELPEIMEEQESEQEDVTDREPKIRQFEDRTNLTDNIHGRWHSINNEIEDELNVQVEVVEGFKKITDLKVGKDTKLFIKLKPNKMILSTNFRGAEGLKVFIYNNGEMVGLIENNTVMIANEFIPINTYIQIEGKSGSYFNIEITLDEVPIEEEKQEEQVVVNPIEFYEYNFLEGTESNAENIGETIDENTVGTVDENTVGTIDENIRDTVDGNTGENIGENIGETVGEDSVGTVDENIGENTHENSDENGNNTDEEDTRDDDSRDDNILDESTNDESTDLNDNTSDVDIPTIEVVIEPGKETNETESDNEISNDGVDAGSNDETMN